MTLSQQIAQWTTGLTYTELPPEAVSLAKRAILDTVGCALAGAAEPAVRIVQNLYAGPAGTGVPLLTGGGWASAEMATLIGGTAAHALDYDDVCLTVTTHPSAAIVPVILAVGHDRRRSGADLLAAYLIGVEVSTRVGAVMGFTHYQLGWHATMTLGTVGAAAAAGYLMGLTPAQLQTALGVACSLAGGLRRNFGTMTKPLHAGLAAQHGVQAALLAEQGLTADTDIFGPGGFFLAFGGGSGALPERLPLGEPFDALASGIAVKRFPCCYATHRLIDAALNLATEHDLSAADVTAIQIMAPPGALAPLNRPRPVTGLEGKFSAEYTAAAAVLDRRVNLTTFTDAKVLRPEVQALLQRVQPRELEDPTAQIGGLDDGDVTVTIALRSGATVMRAVSYPPGAPQRPLTDQDRWEKFTDCLAVRDAAPPAVAALFEAGLRLEQCRDVTAFTSQIAAAVAR